MPLTWLDVEECHITSLIPLKGMLLTYLRCKRCDLIRDLEPLHGMPLTSLTLEGCSEIRDLGPLRSMPLTHLNLLATRQQDISPLEGTKLAEIYLPSEVRKGMTILRKTKSLVRIDGVLAELFWRDYDAGKFSQYKP